MAVAMGMSKIVYSHLFTMVTNTLDVLQVQLEKDHGVPQKLIQMANISRTNGLDAMVIVN